MTKPANTIAINKLMKDFDDHDSVWLFAYGSLIYKVDFPFLERQPARIQHWCRRFWQGSHDHRGTPELPGRVATLCHQPGAFCEGVAYLITPEEFAHLDEREKNGYLRLKVDIHFKDGASHLGVVYIATDENEAFIGPASEQDIAHQIAIASGDSGANSEYLFKLADSLRAMGERDDHVFSIEQHLIRFLSRTC